MTPKEKKQQLQERFENALTVKDCQMIAIDEILKVAFFLDDEVYNHFLEVKQEIENSDD
jgi:hypothetical protein